MGVLFIPMFIAGIFMMAKSPELLRKIQDALVEDYLKETDKK